MTATPSRATTTPTAGETLARSAARLAAVQALYQIDVTAESADSVIKDFLTGRVGGTALTEDPDASYEVAVPLAELDSGVFVTLVRTALERGEDIEGMIRSALSAEWPYDRLEQTLRAILRAAVAELLSSPDVPARVTVTEFIDIAHAFYSGSEPRMVNAVLDRLARALGRLEDRPDRSG